MLVGWCRIYTLRVAVGISGCKINWFQFNLRWKMYSFKTQNLFKHKIFTKTISHKAQFRYFEGYLESADLQHQPRKHLRARMVK